MKETIVNPMKRQLAAVLLGAAGSLFLTACESEKKPEATQPAAEAKSADSTGGDHSGMVAIKEGVAGGVAEETFKDEVTVVSVDAASRQITLTDNSGAKATFVAGPEIRNLDQLRAGDKLTAKITQ